MSKRLFLGITMLVILALPAGCTTAVEPTPAPEAPAAPAVTTQPAATPMPATPAADIPEQTEAEVCAAVWAELAALLPAGYEIDRLPAGQVTKVKGNGLSPSPVRGNLLILYRPSPCRKARIAG